MLKKKIIIVVTIIILTFLTYLMIGCYIYRGLTNYANLFTYSFDCEYDIDKLCESLLNQEEDYLERELNPSLPNFWSKQEKNGFFEGGKVCKSL